MSKLLKLSGTTGATIAVSKVPAHAKRFTADAPHYTYPVWVEAVFKVWAWNYGRSHETDIYCEVYD